jgi:hypothetical protein
MTHKLSMQGKQVLQLSLTRCYYYLTVATAINKTRGGQMNLKELLGDIHAEIEAEKIESLTADDKRLHEIAQRLLKLERDLRVPGVSVGKDARVERLLEEIARENI